MKKILKPLTLLILATSLASCVAVRSEKYAVVKPEDLKVSSTKKSKIFIDWGFRNINSNNLPQNVVDKIVSDQKKFFFEAIKESECCEIVSEKDEANIFIEGKFHNESSPVGIYACFVSGLTFTAIPCWANSKMRITAAANKGKIMKDYDIKDSLFIAFWAPLIVATPFSNPMTVEAEVNKNLYKTLLTQMKKDEFFGK